MPSRTRNKTMAMTRTLLVVAAAWQLRATPLAFAGASPAQLCEAAKLKAASTFAQCRIKADSVYAKSAQTATDTAKRDAAYVKCDAALVKAYATAEAKYVMSCPSVGDVDAVKGYLTQCSADVGDATGTGGAPVPDYVADLTICTSGTATAGEVLSGKTFSSAAGLGATGTMPNNGAVTITPGTASQAIPAGYHNGSGTVAGIPASDRLDFRFTQPNGSGSETSANSWFRGGSFVFRGTAAGGIPTAAYAVIYTTNLNTYHRVRLYDRTNSQVLGVSTASNEGTDVTPVIIDLGTLSNWPPGQALLEIQILATDLTGNTGVSGRQNVGIHSFQVF